MNRKILLLSLLLSLPAAALEVVQGVIVSSGASTNNLTTAVTFQVPTGTIAVQCNADTYVSVGSGTGASVTSSTGVLVPKNTLYDTTTNQSIRVVAILPVSGSSTCKVFQVIGARVVRGGMSSGGSGVCTLDGSQPAYNSEYHATNATGSAYIVDAILEASLDLPGIDAQIGANALGEVTVGRVSTTTAIMRVYGLMNAFNVTGTNVVTAGAAYDLGANAFVRNPTAGKGVPITDPDGLVLTPDNNATTCDAAHRGSLRVVYLVAGDGNEDRFCRCRSDGAASPTYRWKNVDSGTVGSTATECPA